jgi:dipeptidase
MKKYFLLLIAVFFLITGYAPAQDGFNCFTVMAGRNATSDGAVLFAHNEDDYGKQLVNWIAVPKKHYHEGSVFTLKNGGKISQLHETSRHIWLEIPGMDFSDSYLNEYGVCISSNSCASREDNAEITDGGIGYNLRQLLAERATSARDAVELAGRLVEQFGYTASGRTYCVADPNEAWVIAVVKGKHWVAQRIPDDEVMVLPNSYTIREVTMSDNENFLSCPDLIDYAIKRGWYDPSTDGPFNFRNAYAGKNSLKHPGNVNRAWGAYRLLDAGYALTDDFPFSFKPAKKVSKQDLMAILRDHYEGTDLDKSEGYTKGSPYKMNGTTICGAASVYGFVAEMRRDMPVDIGCVMWLAPQWPDIQPFIPLYAGVTAFPPEFCRPDYPKTIDDHYNPPADIHVRNNQHAFWAFVEFSDLMKENYGKNIAWVRKKHLRLEGNLLSKEEKFRLQLTALNGESPTKINELVTHLYSKHSSASLATTRKSIKKLK